MTVIYVAMEDAVLAVRRAGGGVADIVLTGASMRCLTIDPSSPQRLYCGTADRGLLRSDDGGATWRAAGSGIDHDHVTAIAVGSREEGAEGPGIVHAGTEPSAVFRSDDGGENWTAYEGLSELPSAGDWSFPPRPETHHVRWIEPDPATPGRLYVAIEAGALVTYEPERGVWRDRAASSPRDTHTLVVHPEDARRLYSAAGDGYFESDDLGETWHQPQEGLDHRYVWSCAVDPGADVVLVSAADRAMRAHSAEGAETHVYRRAAGSPWQSVRDGLPAARGTTVSSLARDPDGGGIVYAANNHGVFVSADTGCSWTRLELDWPERFRRQRVVGIVVAGGV